LSSESIGKKGKETAGGKEHASSRLSINEVRAKALEAAVGLKIVNAPTAVKLRLFTLSPSL
jgi:hypothetical protein